jgi:hypothetical protein
VAWNVVLSPQFIGVRTYTDVKRIVKFNSRHIQNLPGGINLLDNIREELNIHDGRSRGVDENDGRVS